jgi:putative hydrolase of the HAD superfamily
MVGNSLRSDIIPALEAGAGAAWIPYPLTWEREIADPPVGHPRFVELASITVLPAWLGAEVGASNGSPSDRRVEPTVSKVCTP